MKLGRCTWLCQSSHVRAGTRLDDPGGLALKQFGILYYVEEPALANQLLEIADVVAAKVLVFEIDPRPDPRTPIINIESPRFGIFRNHEEQEQGFGKLNPFCDCGILGQSEQSLYCFVQRSSLFVGHPKVDDWYDVHLSKHESSPFVLN